MTFHFIALAKLGGVSDVVTVGVADVVSSMTSSAVPEV